MREAITKMRNAIAQTVLFKTVEGQQKGLFCEQDHRKEFSLYSDATTLVYEAYTAVKFEKSPSALLAFANEVLRWAIDMEYRLWEIKDLNVPLKYLKQDDVDYVYLSIYFMVEDLLPILYPDVINQVQNILIDSQNKAP